MEEQHDPAVSCVSAHSLHSMGNSISFKKPYSSTALRDESKEVSVDQNQRPNTENNRIREEELTSAQSCVSLKSDWSMEHPYYFKPNTLSLESRAVQCCLSDGVGVQPKSEFKRHVKHSPIMLELRAQIEEFMESELEYLDRILNEDSEGSSEQSRDESDDEDTRRSREAVLQLCTRFLRDMKQDHLAQRLISRTKTAKCVSNLKSNLKMRFQRVFEGVTKAGHQTDLNQIYTDLWITEGHTGGVNIEHEIRQIQRASYKHQDRSVRCQDIFDCSLSGQSVRTMLGIYTGFLERSQACTRTRCTASSI